MAVGDVVSQISGDNAAMDFQPAAGVEVMITLIGQSGTGANIRIRNATNIVAITNADPTTSVKYVIDTANMKYFINNTIYFHAVALGVGNRSVFTGIQIK